jgi:hypothetical protein
MQCLEMTERKNPIISKKKDAEPFTEHARSNERIEEKRMDLGKVKTKEEIDRRKEDFRLNTNSSSRAEPHMYIEPVF